LECLLVALQSGNQPVYLVQKLFLADAGVLCEHLGCTLRDIRHTGLTGPTSHLAVGQQREPTKLIVPARVVQVGQQVLKAKLNVN
jgi:hypothetical protein